MSSTPSLLLPLSIKACRLVRHDSCDSLYDRLVTAYLEVGEAGGDELHDAALCRLPEQPRQVEHPGLEGEHEDDPLVELVVGHPAPVSVHIVLAEAGVRPVLAQGAVKSFEKRKLVSQAVTTSSSYLSLTV